MNSVSSAVGSKLLSTSLLPPSGGEAGTGQFLETPLSLRHGRGIGRIELVPRIASVIKHGRAISGRKWAGLITGSKGGMICALA
jgi:hypothetical protein